MLDFITQETPVFMLDFITQETPVFTTIYVNKPLILY